MKYRREKPSPHSGKGARGVPFQRGIPLWQCEADRHPRPGRIGHATAHAGLELPSHYRLARGTVEIARAAGFVDLDLLDAAIFADEYAQDHRTLDAIGKCYAGI